MNRLEVLLEMLQNEPDDSFTRYAAALEYLSLERFTEAEEELNIILNKNPSYLAAYYQLGKLLERKGEFTLAEEIYTRGIEIAEAQKDSHTKSELQEALDNLF